MDYIARVNIKDDRKIVHVIIKHGTHSQLQEDQDTQTLLDKYRQNGYIIGISESGESGDIYNTIQKVCLDYLRAIC